MSQDDAHRDAIAALLDAFDDAPAARDDDGLGGTETEPDLAEAMAEAMAAIEAAERRPRAPAPAPAPAAAPAPARATGRVGAVTAGRDAVAVVGAPTAWAEAPAEATARDLEGPMAEALAALSSSTPAADSGVGDDGAQAGGGASGGDDDDDDPWGTAVAARRKADERADRERADARHDRVAGAGDDAAGTDAGRDHASDAGGEGDDRPLPAAAARGAASAAESAAIADDAAADDDDGPRTAAEAAAAALAEAAAAEAATARAALALGRLLRVCEADNVPKEQAMVAAQATAKAIEDAAPPLLLTVVGDALFRDDAPVATSPEASAEVARLNAALHAVGRTGVAFDAAPAARDLLIAVRVLAIAARGEAPPATGAERAMRLLGRVARPDGEALLYTTVDRSMALARQIFAAPAIWPYDEVVAHLDALEDAVAVRPGAVFRALALGSLSADAGRTAVEAAALALHVGRTCGVSAVTRRAVAHLAWALALTGTDEMPPPAVGEAANLVSTRILPALQGGRVDPHRLRLAALLGVLARGEATEDATTAAGWSRLLHRIARRRLTERTMTPLIKLLAAEADEGKAALWTSATFAALGQLPVGTVVALEDGRHGVVVDAAPGRVLVDTGGRVEAVAAAVALAT